MYEEFSFLFGEEGFCSSPLTDCEPKKNINKKLTYLGTETFYFAKEDVCKPVFPDSSHRKEKAISEFKQKITEELSSGGRKKSEYKVYIQDFTNYEELMTNSHKEKSNCIGEKICSIKAVYKDINHLVA